MKKINVTYPKEFVLNASVLFLIDNIIYKGEIKRSVITGFWYLYISEHPNNKIFEILNLSDPKFFYNLKVTLDFRDYEYGAWPEAKSIKDLYKTIKILEHFDEF